MNLTHRQLAILRILADADGPPHAASFVAACYMVSHHREELRRDVARQELEALRSMEFVESHTSPGGAILWEITPAGHLALKKNKRAKT